MARRATRFLAFLFLLALLLVTVGCDHATKVTAKAALEGARPLDLVIGVLDLRYAENRDTAFNLLDRLHGPAKTPLILGLSLVALGALAVAWWRRREARWVEQAGFALVAAGAIGNIADRAARGYVVDFIHLAHWPVFNVADVAIVLGGALLVASHASRRALAM